MKKILLVEDEDFIREMYARKLEQQGFEIFQARTTDEAEKILKKQKVDLIVLDLLLPEENGFEYLERMRRLGVELPTIIILSNLEGEEYREKARQFKVKDYFLKTDYIPSEIAELIKKYL